MWDLLLKIWNFRLIRTSQVRQSTIPLPQNKPFEGAAMQPCLQMSDDELIRKTKFLLEKLLQPGFPERRYGIKIGDKFRQFLEIEISPRTGSSDEYYAIGVDDFTDLDHENIPITYAFFVSKKGSVLSANFLRPFGFPDEKNEETLKCGVNDAGDIPIETRQNDLMGFLTKFDRLGTELSPNSVVRTVIRG